jgi:hypothetical protein
MILSNCETLTLKAPYLVCHANRRWSGKLSCTHFEEPPSISCMALATWSQAKTAASEHGLPPRQYSGLDLVFAGDATQKWPESVPKLRRQEGLPIFCAEHTVRIRTDVGHERIQPSLRDLRNLGLEPGSKLPGYSQFSLRESSPGNVQTPVEEASYRFTIVARPLRHATRMNRKLQFMTSLLVTGILTYLCCRTSLHFMRDGPGTVIPASILLPYAMLSFTTLHSDSVAAAFAFL